MPRLFPNLGRSSKEQAAGYGAYDPYYGHPDRGYGYDGIEYEPQQPQRPAWRKMLSRGSGSSSNTKSSDTRTGGRAYYGEGEVPGFQRTVSRSHLSPDHDMYRAYPAQVPRFPNSDDSESFVNIPSRPQSPVPIVQRESSFTDMNGLGRLQEAFADHGTYTEATPTVTVDPTTPLRGSPRMTPRAMHAAGPVQMRTVHEARREPVIIEDSNGSVEGIRPDVDVMRPSSSKHKRHHAQHTRERPPREQHKSKSMEVVTPGPTYWDYHPGVQEYPPVVVVVQRGRYGDKDTYYIIPGGQPVVFEDEYGNEITRVGDFSGYYVPQPLHPVIVEDEFGREICRAGFPDGRISPGPYYGRVNVHYLGGSNARGYQQTRSSRRDHYDGRMYDTGYAPSYVSHSSYDGYTDGRSAYRRHGSSDYGPSRSVMFADEGSMGRRSHRSYSNRDYSGSRRGDDRYYEGSYGQGSSYVDDPYIDPYTRSRSGSGTSSRRYRDVVYDSRH
ncbi:hypothetical protein FOMPIDRAFT_1043621 [Fomitopsis schrenkii]|uniref:Uncharacterized protein n=1 Tax=Fomitopsis schrenkii TaxID=2126942 RepID=S8DW11_FOMSC|nr:hypothetical protein FOMPIDRAFT_1043621 [Fomitopsis schrenkii]